MGENFLSEEYTMNHQLATIKKPVVAMIDGVTMGGGVGISVHAPFRVSTERTLLAMPETQIGFVPDIGSTFVLARLDGELGPYLGLTGQRLKGIDALYSGFATHHVRSANLQALENELVQLGTGDYDLINKTIEKYTEPDLDSAGNLAYSYSLAPYLNSINRCFKFDTVEQIIEALQQETEQQEWASKTLELLHMMSPTSLKLSLEMIRRAKHMSIKQCLNMETQIVCRTIQSHDFFEGVSELLITKTKNPKWDPPTIEEVSASFIQSIFDSLDSSFTLKYCNNTDYFESPYKVYELPSAKEITDAIASYTDGITDKAKLIKDISSKYNSRNGVREKVLSFIS
ncbi:3-hydroxyisobutyryl-CoA hydrolase, mitochondrial [Zancudomyces culisetae]|uniref:3-hydroxyisobutyryl-CoA hydrolase n=1 Tax=Zancudomyces culisetae TaxID=1213189 RepID=A0A1R1PND1_ZANCU|nr:3-hydroxyisobutyryl-CoA hydrolase, mitochondrial [Zancudomyces culisetae]|eukprot:OMH82475.1 3-hydroxyisobutyryl-CoA hydrolase, mitochondrial [Zancudomyces culisetae]